MTKRELSELLHGLGIPVNEGITSQENQNKFPMVIYWPYIEQDIEASGKEYQSEATYQISFYARTPQHEKYRELRQKLRDRGLRPVFYHEYVEKDPVFMKTWHTYFALEVIEDV